MCFITVKFHEFWMSKFNAVLKRVQHILFLHNEEFRVICIENKLYGLHVTIEINCVSHVGLIIENGYFMHVTRLYDFI